jgi:PmbA protein
MAPLSNAADLLDDLLGRARSAGADAADAMLVESTGQSVTRRLGKLERVERAEERELGLRVLVGRRQAIVSTEDLGASSLTRLVENALAIARAVPEDPYAGLATPEQIAREMPELDLDDGVEPSAEALAELAAEAEEAALAEPKVTNSEGAEASWSRSRSTLAATNGFRGCLSRSRHGLSVSVIASDGGGMENDYEYVTVVRHADLPDAAKIGRDAAARAVRRLAPRKVASQVVPVVYEGRIAGGIVRHLASAIGGPSVARGTTFLKDQLGQQIFAEGVTIIDDPLRADGLRSRPFDAEGIPVRRRALVENGRLTTWLLDLASARQLGLETTGHATRGASGVPTPVPSNVWLAPGEASPQQLIVDIEQGFYVVQMLGMGVNPVTGDYSRGAAGFWIENGELGAPVSEVTVAGNLLDMFARLEPANDLEFRYGIDAPTLRIDGMTVAGQ